MPEGHGIAWWYCCLNVRERGMIRQTCEGLVLTLFVGIPKPIWDALWLAYPDAGEAVRLAFLEIYGLSIVTIGAGDEAYEAVAPSDGSLANWVGYSLFVVTPSAACFEGCGQSSFP